MKNYTAEMYAATLTAIASGLTLEAVAAGAAPYAKATPEAFAEAHKAYALGNAYTVSVASVNALLPKAKDTKAKGAVAVAVAVAKHNADNPERKLACVLRSDGSYTVLELSPKRKRKAKGEGKTTRMAASTIAAKCCETDGYTYEAKEVPSTGKNRKFEHYLNGQLQTNLAQGLADLLNTGEVNPGTETDRLVREYYPKRVIV